MKVKVISRDPSDYLRETKHDIHKLVRNYNAPPDPFRAGVEYVRARNAVKLERHFAKPFIASLDGHHEGVHVMAKHALKPALAFTGGRDGEVRVWDLPSRKCLSVTQAHNGPVNGISVDSMTGNTFVTVGLDSQLRAWNTSRPSVAVFSLALDGVAHSVCHVANSTDFVTSGEDVCVWKQNRDSPLRTYDLGVSSIHVVRCNPIEEAVMIGASQERSIWLIDTRMADPLKKVTMKLRPNSLVWNPMNTFDFVAASDDYNLYTFDMRSIAHPKMVHKGHTGPVVSVDFAPTGEEFVSGSFDRTLRIFPSENGQSRDVYHTRRMHQVLSVLFSMDNKLVLSGSNEMNVRVWKARASEKLGPTVPRQRLALEYASKLRETYGEHPEIRRIARHRHLPGGVRAAAHEHNIIRTAQARREHNRRVHSTPGTVPFVPERKKHMVEQDD